MANNYRVILTKRFIKALKQMDYRQQRILLNKMMNELNDTSNPRRTGKALIGQLEGLWRYRYGQYRVIAKIEDDAFVILALEVGHRKDIYK